MTADGPAGPAPAPVRRGWRAVRPFEWVAAASFLLLLLFLALGPVRLRFWVVTAGSLGLYLRLAALTVAVMAAAALLRRAGRGWREALRGSELARPAFWGGLARIAAAMSCLGTAHLLFKLYLPLLNRANHDAGLAAADRILGLGALPVERLAFLAGSPAVLGAFDFLYSNLYYFLVWGGVLVFFAGLEGEERFRFFDGYACLWQGGLLLYFLLPAWGPVFVTPDLFEPLLAHMPATVRTQSVLFGETLAVVRGQLDFPVRYFGLAAFPSLHVAVLTYYALWGRRAGRFWAWWNGAAAALILAGSLLTGYHYLVDGLAGAALAWGCWRVSRPRT